MNDKQKQFIKECIILSSISIYFFQLVLGSILFENINIWIMINMSIIFVLIVMIVYSLYNVIILIGLVLIIQDLSNTPFNWIYWIWITVISYSVIIVIWISKHENKEYKK